MYCIAIIVAGLTWTELFLLHAVCSHMPMYMYVIV